MKKIYIVLTYTGTLLSRIIKKYTKDEYSHASISLDVELNQMYSFGRLNPYNPFIGGFVHEGLNRGTFKRFKNTKAGIYCLEITDDQYKAIEENIKNIQSKKDEYNFNVLGLFAAGFNKKICHDDCFYCAEFVKYIIESTGIDIGLPEIIKPEDFKYAKGLKPVYNGLLRKYNTSKINLKELLENNLLMYTKREGII